MAFGPMALNHFALNIPLGQIPRIICDKQIFAISGNGQPVDATGYWPVVNFFDLFFCYRNLDLRPLDIAQE